MWMYVTRRVSSKILKSYQNVDMIFGTHNIHKLPEILEEAYLSKAMVVEVWSKEGDIIENLPKVREGSTKAWVNIMYGCDKFCTYCIVPFTRVKNVVVDQKILLKKFAV